MAEHSMVPYRAFDIQLMFQGVLGVDVVNGGRYWWEGMSKPFNQTTAVLDRWRKEGDVASLPAAGQNSGANLAFSSWYVESGNYIRLKNLTLGYTLPSTMLGKYIQQSTGICFGSEFTDHYKIFWIRS